MRAAFESLDEHLFGKHFRRWLGPDFKTNISCQDVADDKVYKFDWTFKWFVSIQLSQTVITYLNDNVFHPACVRPWIPTGAVHMGNERRTAA